MTISTQPTQLTKYSDNPTSNCAMRLENLPENILNKIAFLANGSSVNFHLTCKKIDEALRWSYQRANFLSIGERNEKIFSLLDPTKYPNLIEMQISTHHRARNKEQGYINMDPHIQNSKQASLIEPTQKLQRFFMESNHAIDDTLVHCLIALPNLQTIVLNECDNVSKLALRNLISSHPNLQNLSLKRGHFGGLDNYSFANLSHLKSLELIGAQNLSDQTMGNLLAATSGLESLIIEGNPTFSGTAFDRLSSSRLTNLEIKYHISFSYETRKCYRSDSVLTLLNKSRELNSIKFSGWDLDKLMFLPSQSTALRVHLDNVKTLNLEALNIADIVNLMCFGNSIETLNLCSCKTTNDTLKALFGQLTNLSTLDLSYCDELTDHDVQCLTQGIKNLNKIEVCDCNSLTGKAWKFTDISQIRSCKIGTSGEYDATLDSSDLGDMIRRMPMLEHFYLRGHCDSLNANFGDLKGVFTNLRSIHINYWDDLTDTAFENLICNASKLESVDLSYIEKITDYILFPLSRNCRKLKELDVHCPNISESAVAGLKKYISSQTKSTDLE